MQKILGTNDMNGTEIRTQIKITKQQIHQLKKKRSHYVSNIKKTKLLYKNLERNTIEDIELSAVAIFLQYLREALKELDQRYITQKTYYTQLHSIMDELNEKVWV